MKVYTSYFGSLRKKLPNGCVPISIAYSSPFGWSGLKYKNLAPTKTILNKYKKGEINHIRYIDMYCIDVLNKLNPEEVKKDLKALANGKDICLVCYEKPDDFCHRIIAYTWLEAQVPKRFRV